MIIGEWVVRLGSGRSYTTGRKGRVMDLAGNRVQVNWIFEKDGKPVTTKGKNTGKGMLTWCNVKFVAVCCNPYVL